MAAGALVTAAGAAVVTGICWLVAAVVVDARIANHALGSWHDPDAAWLLAFPLIMLVIHPFGSRLVASFLEVNRPSVVGWLALAAVVAGGLLSILTASLPPAIVGVIVGPGVGVLLADRSHSRPET